MNLLTLYILLNFCYAFTPVIQISVDSIDRVVKSRLILVKLNWNLKFSNLVVVVLIYFIFYTLQYLFLVMFKFLELFTEPFLYFYSLVCLKILQLANEQFFGLLFLGACDIAFDILKLGFKLLLGFFDLSFKIGRNLTASGIDIFQPLFLLFLSFFCEIFLNRYKILKIRYNTFQPLLFCNNIIDRQLLILQILYWT
jgi:hypothetical protein